MYSYVATCCISLVWICLYSGAPVTNAERSRQVEPHTHIGKKRKPMSWFSHGCHGQQNCLWARMHDNDRVAQHGGHTPNNRLTETCSLGLPMMYFFDIGHPCCDQLTPVKTRYLLTSITWPYGGLKCIAHRGHMFFFKVDRWPSAGFSIGSRAHARLTCWKPGRIVRKPVNASPGLKFSQIITFSSLQMFVAALFWVYGDYKTQNRKSNSKQKTSNRKVTKLKSTFYLFLG